MKSEANSRKKNKRNGRQLFQTCLQVVRVYIGSFWSQPLLVPDNRKLFEAEEMDLFLDIQSLPRNAALRKLNDLIKRARLAKVSIIKVWLCSNTDCSVRHHSVFALTLHPQYKMSISLLVTLSLHSETSYKQYFGTVWV